jgi:hypothetical protein
LIKTIIKQMRDPSDQKDFGDAVMYDRALQLEKQQEQCLQWTPQKLKLVDRMLDEVYGELQPTKEERDARCYVIQFVDNFVKLRIPGKV